MKINQEKLRDMKYIVCLVCLFVSLIFVSCNKEDEVPPKANGLNNEFVLPQPSPLTQEERTVLNSIRAEYENAIKK